MFIVKYVAIFMHILQLLKLKQRYGEIGWFTAENTNHACCIFIFISKSKL